MSYLFLRKKIKSGKIYFYLLNYIFTSSINNHVTNAFRSTRGYIYIETEESFGQTI